MQNRTKAKDNISNVLANFRIRLEMQQRIGNTSINIDAENFFRDVFNYIDNLKLENSNSIKKNAKYIDLIDNENKLAYQITSNTNTDKIFHTLEFLKTTDDKFQIKIFYLLKKPNLSKKTKDKIINDYKLNPDEIIIDHNDLYKDIDNLETTRLLELNEKYFSDHQEIYSTDIVLDSIIKHLVRENKIEDNFTDKFNTIKLDGKIQLNKLNSKIIRRIQTGLESQVYMEKIKIKDVTTFSELRNLIVNNKYYSVLNKKLSAICASTTLNNKEIIELHKLAEESELDFNCVFDDLYKEIDNLILINDYNSLNYIWIIIAHFFEICDVGRKTE